MKAGKIAIETYVVGSVVTIAVVAALVFAKRYKTAAAVIVVSPFPCPPGIPC